MTLSRFAFGFAFVSGSLLAVGACGDDGGNNNPIDARIDTPSGSDAPAIDAPPDARPVVDFGSNEGGEVRLEYIRHANGTGVGARGTAFFYKDSGTTKFFPFLSLDGCTDLTTSNNTGVGKWPKAQNPDAERTYYDVGASVTALGGPSPFVIAKNAAAAKDPVGRSELANSWYFNPFTAADTDGAMFLPADTTYDIVVPGSATYAAHIYDNAIYMPADWSINSPAFNTTPITMTAATDQTYVFNNATNNPPKGPDGVTPVEIQNLIAFTGPNGPAVICIKKQQAGATTTVVVPGAMVDIARTAYPTGGQVARQTVSHTVHELVDETGGPTNRRIDFLGVWCYAGQGMLVN